jgi:hypothetical protein
MRHFANISLEWLRNPQNNLKIDDVATEIRTQHLANRNQPLLFELLLLPLLVVVVVVVVLANGFISVQLKEIIRQSWQGVAMSFTKCAKLNFYFYGLVKKNIFGVLNFEDGNYNPTPHRNTCKLPTHFNKLAWRLVSLDIWDVMRNSFDPLMSFSLPYFFWSLRNLYLPIKLVRAVRQL